MTVRGIDRWLTVAVIMFTGTVHASSIKTGDTLTITIRGVSLPEAVRITGTYLVDEGSAIRLPLIDPVEAGGLSYSELGKAIEDAYKKAGIYEKPVVSIIGPDTIREAWPVVHVGGDVRRAGRISYKKGMTIGEALHEVGGIVKKTGSSVVLHRQGTITHFDATKAESLSYALDNGDTLEAYITLTPDIGDRVKVTIDKPLQQRELPVMGVYRVDEDGMIRLPWIAPLDIRRLGYEKFIKAATKAYAELGLPGDSTVHLTIDDGYQTMLPQVMVAGAVTTPGQVNLDAGMTVLQAIDSAGGLSTSGETGIRVWRGDRYLDIDLSKSGSDLSLQYGDSVLVTEK